MAAAAADRVSRPLVLVVQVVAEPEPLFPIQPAMLARPAQQTQAEAVAHPVTHKAQAVARL
jgi:hypothetical protein